MEHIVRIMLFAWLVIPHHTRAELLTGHVIGIADGDTLTVQIERERVRVRINGIDAPEMRQAFGQSSRRNPPG